MRKPLKTIVFETRRFILATRSAQRQFDISPWRAVLRLVSARLRYGHGPQSFSIYRLADRPVSEWANYLWEPGVLEQLARINPPPHKFLARNKLDFHFHCLRNNIPTVAILFSSKSSDGEAGAPNSSSKSQEFREISRFVESVRNINKTIFFKPMSGAHGAGAFSAEPIADRWVYQGIESDAADLYLYCSDSHFKGKSWICQPLVEAHDELKCIMAPGALGTLRIITYLSSNLPVMPFAVIRLPAGDNSTDNFSQGTGGNIVAPVDVNSGQIGTAWHSVSTDWPEIEPITHHPDTRCRIPGLKIPFWHEIRDLVLKGQAAIPQLPTLGWDVAVTNSGPSVIEANTEYGIDLLQIAHDRGLRDELAPILALYKQLRPCRG